VLVLVLGIGAAGTDFSGKWALDKSKSQMGQGPGADADILLTVTQDDKKITVETKRTPEGRMGPQPPATYNLDGSTTNSETGGEMPRKTARTAKWGDGGKTLDLNSVTNLETPQGSFTITTKEHWELAEGGKVLRIHQTRESQRGTQEATLVFNKQ
jgi:hypothetical protein